ncbi:PepSY domain-containing protein [Guptibacillus spartinae]|uniref:PepSY domain-containing protein n=1 Tax=Guptibacillus spartinae TaxID=3025679 RepID=UPI00235FB78C|nr:PepSY domain-containing protein [Pseudalkalibacillus spartinae]
MRTKDLLIGALIGAGAAALTASTIASKRTYISPEKALKAVKGAVKPVYTVKGSWIHMKTDSVKKFNLPYTVYAGGLTCEKEGKLQQLEFMVDAETGTLVELQAQ